MVYTTYTNGDDWGTGGWFILVSPTSLKMTCLPEGKQTLQDSESLMCCLFCNWYSMEMQQKQNFGHAAHLVSRPLGITGIHFIFRTGIFSLLLFCILG